MSYPRQLQTLIVEDEQEPTENYRRLFEEFAGKGLEVDPPVFVRSYEDAVKLLSANRIFHIAIVDLGLPQTAHESAQPGVEPGIDLVRRAATREEYPIPVLLVISGRLDKARISSLNESLRREFWHGELVNKGVDQDEGVESAICRAHDYCNIGIHVHDAGCKLCPTLSPREEDLLRRCALGQPLCMGLDLEWWGDCQGCSSSSGTASTGMTKVLMGQFLLKDGKESSRPSFFKFEPKEDAIRSHAAARIMEQKLGHVKVCGEIDSSRRSLLITQQVGRSSSRPIMLADLLANPSDAANSAIPQIICDIVDQLGSLGSTNEDRFPVSSLLWRWHDIENVKSAWTRHGGDEQATAPRLLQLLRASKQEVWARRRTCTHGDLNSTNIALEAVANGYRAYIFDPGGMQADTAGRDLAMLETTLLLHQRTPSGQGLLDECQALYESSAAIPGSPGGPVGESLSPIARNTLRLIREFRGHAVQMNDISVYALMVFDCAMVQLGGLTLQSRRNKIANPRDAVLLAQLTARWLSCIAPAMVSLPPT
jgi:CheY-like chemotaxis protein